MKHPVDHDLPPTGGSAGLAGQTSSDPAGPLPESAETIPIIEETLEVRKVAVDQGGYRINKRVQVHERVVDELLQHERVAVERRPIGRALAAGEVPEARYEGDTLVLPVIEEILVTEKRLMLIEEVRITRMQGTHHDPQRIELRKEEIEIERLGADITVIRSS